ncbi:MAG: c-type cytochrome [Terracidiphilus sp.]
MRPHVLMDFAALWTLAAAFAVVLAGCRSLPPSMPASEWTPQEVRGAEVYQRNCARCHYPTTTRPLHGPGLQALTKLKEMPSGAPPTDERLTDVILHGRQMMPPTPLDGSQLRDLLAYLHTL